MKEYETVDEAKQDQVADQPLGSGASGNRLTELVREAETRGWCVRPYCTTCGNGDFRAAVGAVPDLTAELTDLDLGELGRTRLGNHCLSIICLTQRVDWDRVLAAWLPRTGDDVRLVDTVLFYVIGRLLPFQRTSTMKGWVDLSIELGRRTRDASLVESLVYIVGVTGDGLSKYPEFVAYAREIAEHDSRVRHALTKAGLVSETGNPQHRLKAAREAAKATHSIFLAIRSGDVKGVAALLKKGPDLSARDADGLTALELARKLGKPEIVALLGYSGEAVPGAQ